MAVISPVQKSHGIKCANVMLVQVAQSVFTACHRDDTRWYPSAERNARHL